MADSITTRLILEAIDNTTRTLSGVENGIGKMGKAADMGKNFMAGLGVSIDSLVNPAMLAGQGILKLGQFTLDTANKTAAYGREVDNLSRLLGSSAEEASTLIQIGDDLQISTEQITQAFKEAAKDGITPNLETLKDLAKQYQAIPDPAERAAFALDTFGRAGLEMSKILEKTPEQLDAMAQSAKDAGLIMSEESVQAAIEYQQSLDNLGDSFEGFKTTLGNAVIPVLTDFIDLLQADADGLRWIFTVQQKYNDALKVTSESLSKSANSYREYLTAQTANMVATGQMTAATRDLILANIDAAEVQNQLAEDTTVLSASEFEAARASEELADKQQQLANHTLDTADATEELNSGVTMLSDSSPIMAEGLERAAKAMEDTGSAASGAVSEVGGLLDQIGRDVGSPLRSFIQDMQYLQAGGGGIDDAFAKLKDAADKGLIAAGDAQALAGDLLVIQENTETKAGFQTQADAARDLADALGISYTEADKMLKAAKDTDTVLRALTGKVNKTKLEIYVEATGDAAALAALGLLNNGAGTSAGGAATGGTTGGETAVDGKLASGGTALAGRTYLVGEQGPELFTPQTTGQVMPASQTSSVLNNTAQINLTIQMGQSTDPYATGRAIVNQLRRARVGV